LDWAHNTTNFDDIVIALLFHFLRELIVESNRPIRLSVQLDMSAVDTRDFQSYKALIRVLILGKLPFQFFSQRRWPGSDTR